MYENCRILIHISLVFVPIRPINNNEALKKIIDYSLAPKRRREITWTNDGLVYQRMYVSPKLDEVHEYCCWQMTIITDSVE